MSDKKAPLSNVFIKANFSCDLRHELASKPDFVKMYAGKLTTDINKLHAEILKAKTAYDKQSEKAEKEAEKAEKAENPAKAEKKAN